MEFNRSLFEPNASEQEIVVGRIHFSEVLTQLLDQRALELRELLDRSQAGDREPLYPEDFGQERVLVGTFDGHLLGKDGLGRQIDRTIVVVEYCVNGCLEAPVFSKSSIFFVENGSDALLFRLACRPHETTPGKLELLTGCLARGSCTAAEEKKWQWK
ncbi:MAG: hypothetical protein AAF393_17415 [Pseudomonadota bacterium]